jgi:hypothetical protein
MTAAQMKLHHRKKKLLRCKCRRSKIEFLEISKPANSFKLSAFLVRLSGNKIGKQGTMS